MNGKNYSFPDSAGHFGKYGGQFVPETLISALSELEDAYASAKSDPQFGNELVSLLKDYVGRPTPLYFAERLTNHYGKAKIYLKREDLCHTGAHKINNTVGQILLAKRIGKKRIIAETGAGQHGVATATVAAMMDLTCVVYMGAEDMVRQEINVQRMRLLGAEVVPVTAGTKTLKDATNEALRDWVTNVRDTFYVIGSVVGPHPYPMIVRDFQSIIGKETKEQILRREGKLPDYLIACVGGGSNAAGAFYHFLDDEHVQLIGVEAAGHGVDSGESAATTVLGRIGVLHGSKSLLMQTEDGQVIEPYSISAGLDYPGIGPLHSHLFDTGRVQFLNATDDEAMNAGIELSRLEGIIPAIESAHAVAVLRKMDLDLDDVVVINLSGRGDKDLETYIKWGKY